MTNYLYSPAPHSAWTAIATGDQLMVLDSKDPALLTQLWAEVRNGMHATVGVLTGRGLAAVPAFALIEWSETTEETTTARVIVRGAIDVTVTTESGVVKVSGARISTWSEHNFDGVSVCEVSADSANEECTMPLVAGVVSAQRVLYSLSASGTAAVSTSSSVAAQRATPTSSPTALPISEATMVDRPNPEVNVSPNTTVVSPHREETTGEQLSTVGIDSESSVDETLYRQNPDVVAPENVGGTPVGGVPSNSGGDEAGDHDGMTIMTGDLRKRRAGRAARNGAAKAGAETAPTSSLFVDISTGAREELTQPILVGRAPSVSKVSGGALPRLVTIPDDKDISRNHVQLVVEGGTVVVTDLHSRNGTYVVLPGKEPQRLRAGEPTAVIVGTIVDLGGDVTLTVCEEA